MRAPRSAGGVITFPGSAASVRRPGLAVRHTRLNPRPEGARRRLPSGGTLSTVPPRSDVHGGLLRQGVIDMGLFSNWFKGRKYDTAASSAEPITYARLPERNIRYDPRLVDSL